MPEIPSFIKLLILNQYIRLMMSFHENLKLNGRQEELWIEFSGRCR